MDYRFTLLLAFAACAFAVPTGRQSLDSSAASCSTTCTASSKFSYTPGSTYRYKYEGETMTSMLGASEDHSTIGINALVDIGVISKCEMVLQVHDVSIFAYDSKDLKDQDGEGIFAQTLSEYPLRFSFQDGIIESIFPHDEEKLWAVNIKRGILSAFQNSMDSFSLDFKGSENDVTGNCVTEYKMALKGWKSVSIKKSKDLSTCSHRQGFDSAIQTTPFRMSSGMKSLPIMKSTHTCDQEISLQGYLSSSICHEMHLLRPFSKENSGAATEVTQTLTFVLYEPGLSFQNAECGPQEMLYFDHTQPDIEEDLSSREAVDILQDICDDTGVTPMTSRQFSTLVSTMKRIDFQGLRRVYNQVMLDRFCKGSSERARKFYIDAIPMVGTEASVELMKTLVSNGDVLGTQADLWIASMGLVDHPTQQMIKYVQELIGLPPFATKVLLPLSSMIQSYCRYNPSCSDVTEITDFVQILRQNLDGGCKVDQKNFKKIMMTLRALGNLDIAESAVPSLYNCISESDNSMDIKIAAVQAFRNMPCSADRNNLMGIFRDTDADSEIRIVSYLAAMKCPSQYIISQVLDTLETEEVNQVGSFVWSHLSNLMESSDPENKAVQDLLSEVILDDKFNLERFKYSRNYEGSFFLEKYNTGAKIDSNIIWSKKSFIPRMATLNLTTSLFGEMMNLFEIGGRVEGLDRMLESYFGPVGYYNDDNKGSNEIPDADPQLARLSRKKLSAIKQSAKTPMDQLRGAIYMRMFGNEISYNMFGANNGPSDSMSDYDLYNFLNKLRNNEQQDIALTKNVMFLDSSYTLPTVIGLPLKLAVNGTASVSLNVGGQVDMKNPKSRVVIEGNFEPSGSVEVNSMMSVDAIVTKGGLKMVSTMYTSTGAKGRIELMDGNIFDMQFDITKEKSDILDVKSSFFIVYNDFEKEQKMRKNGRNEETMCTGDRLREFVGLQFCASYSSPNTTNRPDAPNYPFSGPISFSVGMHKLDLPKGYQLQVKTIKNDIMTLFRFKSDTPESESDRAIGLDVQVTHVEKTLEMFFVSPWASVDLTGKLIDTASVKGLNGKISIDNGNKLYTFDSKILIEKTKDRVTYTPVINLNASDWKSLQVNGVLNYVKEKSLDVDLNILGATEQPIIIQGSVLNTDIMVGVKGRIGFEKGDGYVLEAFSKRIIQEMKLRTRYTFEPRLYIRTPTWEIVEFNGKFLLITGKTFKAEGSLEKITKIPFKFNVDMSAYEIAKKQRLKGTVKISLTGPKMATKMNMIYDNRANKNIALRTRLEYNIARKWRDTIFTNTKIKMNFLKNKKIVKISSALNSDKNDFIDANMEANFFTAKFSTKFDATVKYGETANKKGKTTGDAGNDKTIGLKVVAKHPNEKALDYTVNLVHPGSKLDLQVSGENRYQAKSVKSKVRLQYHPERVVVFEVHLHNKSDIYPNYAGALSIKLPMDREVSFAGGFGKENDNKYISNLEFEIIKGRRTKIDTVLKIATEKMYEFEVGIQVPEVAPLRVLGAYIHEDNSHSVEASFKKGDNLYRIYGQGIYEEDKTAKVILDFTVPSRRVKIMTGMSRMKTERHVSFDVQWNADKNLDDRFLTNITYDFKSWNDFEIATNLHYPSRKIDFDMKHSAAARYLTNVELSWSPEDKLKLNLIFRDDVYYEADRTELSVEFVSPFEGYEELGLAVSLIRDLVQFQTKSSLTWGKRKKIIVSSTAKMPVSIESVDIVGSITTPFDDFKSMAAQIKHRWNDALSSEAVLQWGRKKLSFNTTGQLVITDFSRKFDGSLVLRTPFEELRIFALKVGHEDDYHHYKSMLTMSTTEEPQKGKPVEYELDIRFTHQNDKKVFSNKGNVHVVMPNDDIATEWELSSIPGSNRAMINVTPKRKNTFKVDFSETHQTIPNRKFSSSFELRIPMEAIRELLISFEHEDKPGIIETSFMLTKDFLDLADAKFTYQNRFGSLKMDTVVKTHFSEDLTIKLTSAHSLMPYVGFFQMKYGDTPYQVTADSSVYYDDFGVIDHSLKVSTPIRGMSYISVISKRKKVGLNWQTENTVTVERHSVSVLTTYRIDHIKLATITLKSSFPQFPGLTLSLKVDGILTNFNGDASFEMSPYVHRISSDFNFAYYVGTSLTGAFNLKTPFPQYPYMKLKFDSNKMGISRISNFEVEYMPTQIFKLQSDYRFTSQETLKGTVTITSPQTNNQAVVAEFTHVGNRKEFKTKAEITCDCFATPVYAESTFSSKNGIDSTFDMQSPFRGYETVKWSLHHEGSLRDFHTKAEYETNGKSISFENLFTMKDSIQYQITFLTPFANITRTHFQLAHRGTFPNTDTHSEVAYNENLIVSDFSLKHLKDDTEANVVITTPFKRYEDMTMTLKKSGGLNNFKADIDLHTDQHWVGRLEHQLKDWNIATMASLKSPLLIHEARMSFTHATVPNGFQSDILYTLGPEYTTTGKAKFYLDLPNLIASTRLVTSVGEEDRINEVSIQNLFDYRSSEDFDITTTLSAQIREMKANTDFTFSCDLLGSRTENKSMLLSWVTNLPIEDYSHSEVYFKYDLSQMKGMSISSRTRVDLPKLELFKYRYDGTIDDLYRNVEYSYSYGDYTFSVKETFVPGRYVYMQSYPFEEKYSNLTVEIIYGGSLFEEYRKMEDRKDWYFTTTVSLPSLDDPIKLEHNGDIDLFGNRLNKANGDFTLTYPDGVMQADIDFVPGTGSLKITTPYESYKTFDFDALYSLDNGETDLTLSASSSALKKPVKLIVQYGLDDSNHIKMLLDFSSEFQNFTHYKLDTDVSLKSGHLKLIWEDKKGTEKMITVDGPTVSYDADSDGMQAKLSMSVVTPFEVLEEFSLKCEHRHFTSPLKAKELLFLSHNNVEYLNMDTEFGALNKFSGIIRIQEPRQMEFSLTGTNEGESVEADLLLNWNKLADDSSFRLQFGLADSGNADEVKKTTFIRVVNPGRIISLNNDFSQTINGLHSSGKISWDEAKRQEMGYDYVFDRIGDFGYSTKLDLALPSRKIMAMNAFSYQDSKLQVAVGVNWDAVVKDKHFTLSLNFDPTNSMKITTVKLLVPSLNKAVTLTNEVMLNEGSTLIDGVTQLSYSPEQSKNVIMEYSLLKNEEKSNEDEQSFSGHWTLKHEATDTMIKMVSEATVTDSVTNGNLQLNYRSANQDLTALNLKSALDLNDRSFNIVVSNDGDTASLKGQMTSVAPYTVTVGTYRDDKPTWITRWIVDTDQKTLDAVMTYDNMKGQIVTQALLPNSTSFMSKTLRQSETEGTLTANLEHRKLHGHLKWRPEIIAESAQYISDSIQQATKEMSPVLEKCMKGLGNELSKKHQLISDSLYEELSQMSEEFKQEMSKTEQDLKKMRRELKKLYRENAFYMKTIEEYSAGTIKSLLSSYSDAIEKLNTAYTKVQERVEEITNKIGDYRLTEKYNELMDKVTNMVQEMEVILIKELEKLTVAMDQMVVDLSNGYNEAIAEISDHFQKIIEVLLEELALTPYLDDLQVAINNLPSSGMDTTELKQFMSDIKEVIVKVAQKSTLVDKAKTSYKMTDKLIREQLGDIVSNKRLQDVQNAISDLHDQVSWLYKYAEMNLSLRDLVQKIHEYLRKKVMEEFNQLPLGLFDLHKSKVTTFDLENGEIEFDLYLPMPMENFQAIMKQSLKKYIAQMKQKVDKYFPRRDVCLWDLYYNLPPVQLAIKHDLIPPFDVFGTMSGKQHFTTFDGHHYDVSGLCSYVLAHDMVDGNFTVALKYQGGPRTLQKESIVVLVAGQTIEMFQDYMVKVNDKPTELPYRSYKLSIVRTGNSVTLTSDMGLTVVSDFVNDYHVVGISGWYYGKVGGLLGSYDNELHNDLMKPDGKVIDNVRRFFNSWEVDRSCRSTMVYTEDEPVKKSSECESVFNTTSSSLRPCFLHVLPDSYQHSCDMDPAALCDITHLYVQTCSRHGINLNLPATCVKCPSHNEDEEFTQDETLRYEDGTETPVRDTMDIVFVVEDRQCNKHISSKLKDVVYHLEQSLSKSGQTDNRYSIVGYAGSMIDSHTMEGKIFNEATKFTMGLENLHFNNLGPYTDPLSALKYASSLPFRTGVKKILVLVSCSPCEETKGYSYSTLSNELRQKDITLHVFRQNGFQLTNNRSPNLHIYGIDNKERYLQKENDNIAHSDIVVPHDYCASLALDSDGSIFDSGYMVHADRVRDQRQFMSQFSERIKQKASPCQICSCEIDEYGSPRTVCRTCVTRQVTIKPIDDLMTKVSEYSSWSLF